MKLKVKYYTMHIMLSLCIILSIYGIVIGLIDKEYLGLFFATFAFIVFFYFRFYWFSTVEFYDDYIIIKKSFNKTEIKYIDIKKIIIDNSLMNAKDISSGIKLEFILKNKNIIKAIIGDISNPELLIDFIKDLASQKRFKLTIKKHAN